ncbi:MAG: hypothetical protein EP338_12195 [Bacteroidetes bacterium]|nr:MAG: hypothetical protein EP338_12195 [Bacteroidota bacterium]
MVNLAGNRMFLFSKTNRFSSFGSLLAIMLLFLSCQGNSPEQAQKQQSNCQYAKHFRLTSYDHYNKLEIINPDDPEEISSYLLLPRGQKAPKGNHLPIIETPVNRAIVLSATSIGMMAKLSESTTISGVSSMEYVYDPLVKEAFKQGKIMEVPSINQLNPERVYRQAEILLYNGFGQKPAQAQKLEQLGVHCLPIYDWREAHPLGKAEWIILFGALTDQLEAAQNYLQEIEEAYKGLIIQSKKLPKGPRLLSGSIYGDHWHMPAAESFNAELYELAGANYKAYVKPGSGSAAYNLEEVLEGWRDVPVWINPQFKSKQEMLQSNSKYAYFKAFQDGELYCYTHDPNRFWEYSAIEPHHVLSDLMQIIHRGKIPEKKLYFYRKISE